MNVNQERIAKLQQEMQLAGIDVYLVPTADFHQSEYVGDYFKARAWLSGFTGSAGTLIVTKNEARLWTDGRYFIQAGKQLAGTGVTLMKMGEEGVPTVEEFIEEVLPQKGCLGCDGRTISVAEGRKYEELLEKKEGTFKCQDDLAGKIWSDRPQMSKEPVYILDVKYAGETREEKIARVRREMEEAGAQIHVISSLDDIVWLLNIRGNDIEYNPVVLSYVILTMDQVHFYVQEEAVSSKVREELEKAGVVLHPYFQVYEDVKKLEDSQKVMLEDLCTNYSLYKNIPQKREIIFRPNPAAIFKGNKNPVEMENLKVAHIKDARAMCRFIYWLKKNVPGGDVTEYSASLESKKFRMEDPDCLDLSFETICAYGPNAAMCHYAPTETDYAKVEPKGFFLIDSGGQYWQGTTDITRTIAVGELTREQKEHFTLVLQGHIRLAMAKFQEGCSGANLDVLVRGPLWARGLDFNHGTGHGVGYLLNVHEGPQNINWKIRANGRRGNATPLEEGMLTSDEPGLYLEGRYGIRTENLLLCKKAEKNGYGQFMEFETVTLVPYEREAILPEMLTREELEWLNDYHRRVYDTIGPMLIEEEREWLKEATAEI
ncbi:MULTISPECIES: aminopeptidase P family protein [unclassified Blautia]|uniref:aminopeptidase P family protein n=1 Tax=unclassified Blautia TaxID=2648079 RepID=UPI000B3AE4F0|nr:MULTISPECIES: aminopeptidase P family protein [unclassified Blautia]OUN26946.1 peptidase M24 [Blautia sp. An81]OUN93785.1 peptidase M24 [Blautia sp. An46]